ncbi:hypothetical protein N0B31_12715 [Salinirubellus salinus]|jgi:hypothetical protein|uniref:Uncharacterized protein n=1 Tax=Salinirubellus salinus TaxID=1364945 RepID=A0A9E7U397_9EURY|nr:hypothetical protein [Salinirubellus salinus]UWM53010.1 hypothetical protein N0B31_12715 [Salinirubellus salinus]
MSTGSSDEDLRETLLEHSDHRAVRNVFQAHVGGGEADLTDLLETMRATDGVVALVAQDGAADVYARWNGTRFEHLSVWPPWTITNYDHTDRADLERFLDGKANVRPTLHDATPFASPTTVGSLQRFWP